eukprot:CAMPEP_0116902632 /NCGR_PEP_ID=MMETSP0467-20121206/10160_1 /TAXON_ID=283647 /ORGANISM="Mesodinium pulex, Strain SPMC105" /LENGTH=139 /DNA_ID=CAMNT_0004576565 /DNA_START=895 /DNA_END=1314 /DNA_ORIENTATION=+
MYNGTIIYLQLDHKGSFEDFRNRYKEHQKLLKEQEEKEKNRQKTDEEIAQEQLEKELKEKEQKLIELEKAMNEGESEKESEDAKQAREIREMKERKSKKSIIIKTAPEPEKDMVLAKFLGQTAYTPLNFTYIINQSFSI